MTSRNPATPNLALVWALLALSLVGGAHAALLSRLPATGEIPGWATVKGGDREATSQKGLFSLYDGAAPDMTQAGIILASQRVYARDNKRLTIDVYKFVSSQKAALYYQKRKSEISKQPGFAAIGGVRNAVQSRSGRTQVGYLSQKQFCCIISVNGTGAAEKNAIQAFAAAIAHKITSLP